MLNYDARTLPSDNSSLARPRFTLAAHDGATPGLDVNPHIRGCLVTGGTDKLVKIWNVLGDSEGDGAKREVSLVTSRDLGVVRDDPFNESLLLIFCVPGKSVLRDVFARRPTHGCSGRVESQIANLGRSS